MENEIQLASTASSFLDLRFEIKRTALKKGKCFPAPGSPSTRHAQDVLLRARRLGSLHKEEGLFSIVSLIQTSVVGEGLEILWTGNSTT